MGVAKGLLQERPLQFQHGNVRVKSWQPMSNPWSTSSQPDFVRNLGRRKTSTKSPGQDFVYRVAQKLVNSWSTPLQLPIPWEVTGVFLAIVLWQHPTKSSQITEVPKSEFLECAFGSHPFSFIFPPLSLSGPVHSPTTSPLFTSRKLRFRCQRVKTQRVKTSENFAEERNVGR